MSAHAASAGVEPSIARSIFAQARPIFVGQVAVMLYGVDTVLTSHASATDLAAMGLGTGVYSSIFVSMLGAINALNLIIAQHHGGRRHVATGALSCPGSAARWLLPFDHPHGATCSFSRRLQSRPDFPRVPAHAEGRELVSISKRSSRSWRRRWWAGRRPPSYSPGSPAQSDLGGCSEGPPSMI